MFNLILLFLLIATPAFALDNPLLMGYPNGKIMGFRGLDTNSSAPMIEDGRSPDMLNVSISSSFDLKRRDGYSVINDTLDDIDSGFDSPAITGIFDAEYSNTTSFTLAFLGNKLRYDNAGTWTNVTGTATITSGKNYQFKCVMALDKAVCTNNQDRPLLVTSTPNKVAVNFTGPCTLR